MAKRVCIVGAGPSGLVAAKTLLHNAPSGAFTVTVYEAQKRIGGLWPTRRDDTAGLVHPLMIANQSKHTVQFSDHAWSADDPEFPRAWQVGRYLERYLERYKGADVKLGHRVVKTELAADGTWSVTVKSDDGEETSVFDYLLVSSGIFGKPVIPDVVKETEVPVIHSSEYRDLNTLFPEGVKDGGKILVVGGQMSGVEIAGTIATHISAAVNAPGPSPLPGADKLSVHHIIQRPVWVFPLHTTPKPASAAAPFLPLDFPSYNLGNRPHPLENSQGHITPAAAKLTHSIYAASLGQDQSDFSPSVAVTSNHHTEPAYLAVSENYMEFVRSGLITVSNGKLVSLTGTTASTTTSTSVDNIAAVVLATGFDSSPSLSFLPSSVLSTLQYSPDHPNLPIALSFHGTHVKDLPTLGFVGFYRSPYWGVMEMQARFLAARWTPSSLAPPPPNLASALLDDASDWRTISFRDDARVSQFPMGDYAYLMQEFSSALSIPISPTPKPLTPALPHNNKPMDILTPARYLSPLATPSAREQAESSLSQTATTAAAGLTTPRFVAKAVFRSLLGAWRLERTLTSRLPSHPNGHFSGTAKFLLRDKTPDGLKCVSDPSSASLTSNGDDEQLANEYLYVEDGEFRADNGLLFRATRRYVWRYDEKKDSISVWFAKTDDAKRADYLFHEIEFLPPPEGEKDGWKAKAGHLCIDDYYNVNYDFVFKAVNLKEWNLAYTVNGPKKDYTIDGVYRR
ncbi:putative flavin-containing monooxygenase 1 [Colletotrichum sidae]|uniref:Putative flavin-containing monooxygenase 1 n=1 Tax=Colletotrichum sidae TaxID=1347389 RepID=A0A4V3I3Q1_9PEZI|nr:putative flavin-containing monooxygenase 1 [Colletotrichum sidae]